MGADGGSFHEIVRFLGGGAGLGSDAQPSQSNACVAVFQKLHTAPLPSAMPPTDGIVNVMGFERPLTSTAPPAVLPNARRVSDGAMLDPSCRRRRLLASDASHGLNARAVNCVVTALPLAAAKASGGIGPNEEELPGAVSG